MHRDKDIGTFKQEMLDENADEDDIEVVDAEDLEDDDF